MELRLLAMMEKESGTDSPGSAPLGHSLLQQLESLEFTPEVLALVDHVGLAEVWDDAVRAVIHSSVLAQALSNADPGENPGMAVGKALVAQATVMAERRGNPHPHGDLRDRLQCYIADQLGGTVYGVSDWLGGLVTDIAYRGTALLERRRGGIMAHAADTGSDVLAYQANGNSIRAFIRRRIEEVSEAGPVVVLAHSLGGIAAFELLATAPLDKVEGLITVGSQAPYMYEIGALAKVPFGVSLPAEFPRWLNIYDRLDFLSFVGEALFPGRVQDVEVDSRQPFPASHSAYWTNPATWKAIAPFLERVDG